MRLSVMKQLVKYKPITLQPVLICELERQYARSLGQWISLKYFLTTLHETDEITYNEQADKNGKITTRFYLGVRGQFRYTCIIPTEWMM